MSNLYKSIKSRELYWLINDYVPNKSKDGELMVVYIDYGNDPYIMERGEFHAKFEKVMTHKYGKKYKKINKK